ncbi:MAG: YaaA family protein [Thermoleophilia bacterium]
MLLLPPSEGKAEGGDGAPWGDGRWAHPELHADRRRVRDAVRAAIASAPDAAGRLLGARGPLLDRALADWRDLDGAPTLPALERYSGVVWGALAPRDMDRGTRARLRRRVLVPSGLWGLVAAGDPLPAYRLRMGASVAPVGGLAAFWRPRVTPLLAARAGRGWIVDLLPGEHRAAVDARALGARLVTVELWTVGPSGERRAAGHDGKAAKGRLARAILEADARTPEAIAALEVPGLTCAGLDRTARDRVCVSFNR